MIHVADRRSLAELPGHRRVAAVASLTLHGLAVWLVLIAARSVHGTATTVQLLAVAQPVTHLIFVAREATTPVGGGGGGGNRQPAPIRRAEAIGTDRLTVRVAKPVSAAGREERKTTAPQLILDAVPLASGDAEQLGLPMGGVSGGTALGPGSGGGVGEGAGTGIGPGQGPGIGPGSGGGIGGGVYRAGGAVTPPRVITEVKPTYTNRAMVDRLEGSVVLELIIRLNGVPSDIRVVRSLDPGGLDEEAIRAASQWRFEPGRFRGTPVDVLASLQVDFHLR